MNPLILADIVQSRGRGARAVRVLHGVSLSIGPGEVVLLDGPSGAGKTTLLSVGGGLLTPESGTVDLAGKRLHAGAAAADRRHRAKAVGFVFQRCNLLPDLTVWENILLMGRIAGGRADDVRKDARTLLDGVGLGRLRDRFPRELSGGEEQRAAVVRALIHRPPVVLADEPTGSLDGKVGLAVADCLAEMSRRFHSAVLVASHDARLTPFATRTLRIEDGRILA